MSKLYFGLILLLLFLIYPLQIKASVNPTEVQNNKYGIHIMDENDLEDAARLVNSSGGDWGYVTFVIREDERDVIRWQKIFDRARRLHLIPIVRIATTQEGENWKKPDINDISSWTLFLEKINWVVKNRYLIIGNEPNHATEWGGEVNPSEYAEYLENITKSLKISSSDYFLMMAGFDASAPDNKTHMSEEKYLKKMVTNNPNLFENIDGWASHSYPNPNFSSSPQKTGQKSVKTYDWELSVLKKLGVTKSLPVFITETGWAHNTTTNSSYLESDTLTEHFKQLYDIYNNDSKIIAFTPFILNYTNPPFDVFSWKKNDGLYYPFFEETQKMLKVEGRPEQVCESEIIFEMIPEFIKKNNEIFAAGIAKNTGQSIWTIGNSLDCAIVDNNEKIEIDSPVFTDIEPGRIGIILYRKI